MTTAAAPSTDAPPLGYCARCGRHHRTWHGVAKCLWQRATLWIAGDGRWATRSCRERRGRQYRRRFTIMLHPTRDRAVASLAAINGDACGSFCVHDHELIDLADFVELEEELDVPEPRGARPWPR